MVKNKSERVFRVSHEYRDRMGYPDDQFLAWINDGLEKGIPGVEGIRQLKYANGISELPSCIILVTTALNTASHNPWDDIIDHENGEIIYWGDAKHCDKRKIDEFKGNKAIRAIYDCILKNEKEYVPPILHFSKPRSGYVVFNGLCVLDKLELSWFEDRGKPVHNYRLHLTILDCAEVSIMWLHNRVKSQNCAELRVDAPKAWNQYLRGDKRKLELWKSKVKSKEEQLPSIDSVESKVLESICEMKPIEFEAVVVALFRQMNSFTHSIYRTRLTGDGGFDFYGSFIFPRPMNYNITFLGEAKKYSRKNRVEPTHVSRLVARLARGEYGIFVTTSYFSKQAQEEVIKDNYPIKLISGIDLINIMKELGILRKSTLDSSWIESVKEGMGRDLSTA